MSQNVLTSRSDVYDGEMDLTRTESVRTSPFSESLEARIEPKSAGMGGSSSVINRLHRLDTPNHPLYGGRDFEPTLLDLDSALRNLGGDEELLCEIARVFVDDVPGLARDLEAAFHRADFRSARLLAHSLKGLCATFGAEPARGRAQKLEHAFADGSAVGVTTDDINTLSAALADAIDLLRHRVISGS